MPKFHVKDTFEVPDRGLFVLAGSIVDGIVRSGMFVHLGFFAEPTTAVRIHRIEFARRHGGEDVCLCIQADEKLTEFLRGLRLSNQTYEIMEESKEPNQWQPVPNKKGNTNYTCG